MLVLCRPSHSAPSLVVNPHSGAPRGTVQSLPQLSAWPFLLGGMKLEIMSLLPPPTPLSKHQLCQAGCGGPGSCAGVQSSSLPRAAATPSSR